MRQLDDGTWYCERCDRRFDSYSVCVMRDDDAVVGTAEQPEG